MHLILVLAAMLEFGKGPAQWIMTGEEQKAWRAVKTEEEAKNFADLFWARRDPTPGTLRNEFRDEFDGRVEFADRRFNERGRRGALTERGRVLIVLGYPTNMSDELARSSLVNAESGTARDSAARDVWTYTQKDAMKYGMPKLEVVFIHDGPIGSSVRRDPQRMDFTGALPNAIKLAIVNPGLKEVPDWAKFEKQFVDMKLGDAQATLTPPVGDPLPQAGEGSVGGGPSPAPAGEGGAQRRVRAAGAGRLTFVKDAWAIKPQSGKDPFEGLADVTDFTRNDELGWAAEYCTGVVSEELPSVVVKMTISGIIKGEKINFRGEPEEMVPDSIRIFPGCYVVRGAIPLADFDPGTYTVSMSIGSYNLSKEVKVH